MAAAVVQSADESQYGTSGGMAPFEKDGRRSDQDVNLPFAR